MASMFDNAKALRALAWALTHRAQEVSDITDTDENDYCFQPLLDADVMTRADLDALNEVIARLAHTDAADV